MTTKNAPAENPIVKLREQFEDRSGELAHALPAHIPVERFKRVVMTAVQRNPDLVNADRVSLFNSALQAAQDGLLPDGREGALVIYRTKVKGKPGQQDVWKNMVQWMPMIAGVLKKARNSGEIASIDAHVVHENDVFSYRIGTDEVPVFEPDWFGNRGKEIGAYAVAVLKDGSKLSEVMSRDQVEAVRAVSRAAENGPWVKWWGEMARKTVLRRLSKRLPMSSDLDDLIRRDDALYDFDGQRAPDPRLVDKSKGLTDRMAALAAPPARLPDVSDVDGDTDPDHAGDAGVTDAGEDGSPSAASPASTNSEAAPTPEEAEEHGYEAAQKGASRKAVPGKFRNDDALKAAWLAGFDRADAEADEGGEG